MPAGADQGMVKESEQILVLIKQGLFDQGYFIQWSGQFEYMERAVEKLKIVVPLTLFLIVVLLYLNFRRMTETLIVMLSVPFALVGGVWLIWWLGYNLSVAVAVGFIALAGVAAETGVVMAVRVVPRASRNEVKGVLGDALKVVLAPGADPSKIAFFMPTAPGPCRFGQYAPFLRRVLDTVGATEAMVVSPSSGSESSTPSFGSGCAATSATR